MIVRVIFNVVMKFICLDSLILFLGVMFTIDEFIDHYNCNLSTQWVVHEDMDLTLLVFISLFSCVVTIVRNPFRNVPRCNIHLSTN